MKNKKRYFKQLLALTLATAVSVTAINFTPFLEGRAAQAAEAEAFEANKVEMEAERTEDSTTYLMPDGSYQTIYYASPVRYKNEDGELVDYDETLQKVRAEESEQSTSLDGYLYENKEGDKKNYLPEHW